MKPIKCPYCGRRVSYSSCFASRRKAEYVCRKCGKESKVVIDKKVILFFVVAAVISLAIMAGWILNGLISNPLGIVLVAVPLIIFGALTPRFVHYEPFKKYQKSMEAKKAGIAYSDNLLTSEFDEAENYSFPSINTPQPENNSDGFAINSDIFNKIKAERNAAREHLDSNEISSDSSSLNKQDYIPVKSDVVENHASSGAGLKKIHSETPVRTTQYRSRHYINSEDNSQDKKSGGNRYSANRKF